jgi:uncharacterized membrane protein
MFIEGEQIQHALEKFPTQVDHFFSMDSMTTNVSFGGSGGKGGTVGLGGGSVERFLV